MDPVVLPRSEHGLSRKLIDPEARKVLYRLHNHGYLAYLVGGSVRDILLGREPKDFDIATNAHPSEVRRLFRNSRTIGRRFRLVHVFFRDGTIIEVSTFRKTPDEPIENEADPATEESDASFAENNTFGTPEEDATRRDFTINALFYDISSFSILDYTGGLADLDRGIIRTIGDPYVRFVEDPVRILRALDYSARLGFTLEPSTEKAIQQLMPEILRGAPSRLTEEILEVFRYGFSEPTVRLFYRYDVFHYLLPSVQKALLHENDAWMKSLIKLDSLVQSSRIKPSDTLIFSLLFMPVLVNRTQPLTPSSAMQFSEEIIDHKDILVFPKRLHHTFQQILVSLARMQNPPHTLKLKRQVTRQHFPEVLHLMNCILEAYPSLVQHFHHWRGVYRSFRKNGNLSPRSSVKRTRRSR